MANLLIAGYRSFPPVGPCSKRVIEAIHKLIHHTLVIYLFCITGFSAGAMVTSGALLQPDAAARPNFAAMIYGSPFGVISAIPA
jgi:energy-converting hydrogenase Eha subunit G